MKIHTKLHNANNSEKHFEKSADMMCIRLSLTTKSFLNAFNRSCLVTFNTGSFNPRSLLEEIVTRSLDGGGVQSDPHPSNFDTIYPIDLKFGTYSKHHSYFQLSETTWCLIGFHGNSS